MATEEKKDLALIDEPLSYLDKLAEIGKDSDEVEINKDFKLTINTLGSEDENKVFVFAAGFEGSEYFSKHKRETLVYSISAINGKSLREYEKIQDIETYKKVKEESIAKIRRTIDKWNDDIINFIYAKYHVLVAKNEKKLEEMKIVEPMPVVTEKEEKK